MATMIKILLVTLLISAITAILVMIHTLIEFIQQIDSIEVEYKQEEPKED